MNYETLIGIETHIQLATNSKLFCSCKTDFGQIPNSNCCPVCFGVPGALPKLNKTALDYAIIAGIATNCTINKTVMFDRKNYFYTDLPKGYQITQHRHPLCTDGYVELSAGKKVRISSIHLEEDSAKQMYKNGEILIDHNRSGIALIEIVSAPDICSAQEAKEYIIALQQIIKKVGISYCKMHEGAMRCDVNISVKQDSIKGPNTKTEIKNINSIAFIVDAINYETQRQISAIETGQFILQETRRFNETTRKTESMRQKENACDYRYFKEPDLPVIKISDEKINMLKVRLNIS